MPSASSSWSGAIRLVALFEAAKGVLALLAGVGALSLMHRDVHALALTLLEHAHLNPASRYPGIFLKAADNLHDTRLWSLAAGAAGYAALRLLEAYGLLRERPWAELLAALSGAIYLPMEALAMLRHPTPLHALLLVLNLAIVVLMVASYRRRRAAQAGASSVRSRGTSAR